MEPPISRDQSPEKVGARMRAAFEMYEAGLSMLKGRLRSAHPDESPAEIQARVAAWLRRDRPGGDDLVATVPCRRFSPPS